MGFDPWPAGKDVMATQRPHTIVLGAGPVGLAAALLLAAQGHDVTLFEAKDHLELDPDNSYPIGVNRRGQEALRRIDPALLQALREEGEVVDAFNIYAGTRRVAHLKSGTLIATTRAFLTRLLLERAQATEAITYVPGHKLASLDLGARTLRFDSPDGPVDVDAREARVVAADGTWSAARRALQGQVPCYMPRVAEWGLKFRVILSQPGANAPQLDPAVHHIFTSKGIYTATLGDGVWCVVVAAIEGDPSEEMLLSTDTTPENIRALQAHVAEHAPLALPLLTGEDYAAFFSRAPFSGAVTISPRLAFEEWLVLVGDAAHGVIPATGEGVNAGLEDAFLLAEHAASGSPTWFAEFETQRLPDVHALGEYAWTLRDNIRLTDPVRRGANVVLRIVDTVADALPLVPSARTEARLFGPEAGLTPYREVLGPWKRQRNALLPVAEKFVAGVWSVGSVLPQRRSESAAELRFVGMHPLEAPARITVIGGSKGTGREVVSAAVRARHDVTVVSRSGVNVDGVRVVTGDASDAAVAREAVRGADAVVITVGGSKNDERLRTRVTEAVVQAMQETGVKRLVVQTSLGAGDSASQLPSPQRQIAPKLLAKPLADHDAQEDVVRASGLEWTIVRPAGLRNSPATGRWQVLRAGQPGTVGGMVARGDVALCLLDALGDPSTIGVEFGVAGR